MARMAWWQIAALAVLGSVLGGALMILRARLAQLSLPLPAATPTTDASALADLVAVRAEWATFRKQLDAYLEAFSDIEETVERKRRRTAASASKMAALEAEPQADADPRAELRQRARSMGLPV